MENYSQEELKTIVSSGNGGLERRIELLSLITDDIFLFTVALSNKYNSRLSEKALSLIQNKDLISAIAFCSSHPTVRMAAVGDEIDEFILSEIALKDFDADVREIAIKKIDDDKILKAVVLFENELRLKELAISKIKDTEILRELVLIGIQKDK